MIVYKVKKELRLSLIKKDVPKERSVGTSCLLARCIALKVALKIGESGFLKRKALIRTALELAITFSGIKSSVSSFIIPLDKAKLLSPSGVMKQNALPIFPDMVLGS